MSSRLPADIAFSLEAFSRHGGLEGPHKDGWGIAHFVDHDVQLVKEPLPASDSACVRFIHDNPFTATLVVSHIRKATRGAVALKNCQPFTRELGGRMHVFAHNGHLDHTGLARHRAGGSFRPVGDTDSEQAFCVLLERLRDLWLGESAPDPVRRIDVVAAFAADMRALGPANFIYCDGDALYVHGHKRTHHDSPAPRPPGLHLLCRTCNAQTGELSTPGLRVTARADQSVVLVASVPLTNEPGWRPLGAGELVVVQAGHVATTR